MVSSMKKSLILIWFFYMSFAACMERTKRSVSFPGVYDSLMKCKENVCETFYANGTLNNFIFAYSKLTETSFQNHSSAYGYYLDLLINAKNAVDFNSWTPELYCSERQSSNLQECLDINQSSNEQKCLEAMRDSKFEEISLQGSEALDIIFLDFSDEGFYLETDDEELNNARLTQIFPNWMNSIPEDQNENFDYVSTVRQSFIEKAAIATFDNPNDYCERIINEYDKIKKN